MSDTIVQWLERLGLGQYAEAFQENAIGLEHLPDLDHDILKEIGVRPAGHRMTILKAAANAGSHVDTDAVRETDAAPPTPSSSPEAERRQLTVMFCDMAASTELSQQLDPEDLSEVNRAYQDACKGAIERYDGHVARYMGDGVLAYFGYPQAHEDDAERAVHAGLRVVESVVGLNATVGDRHGISFGVRVGIATGPVVVGDVIGEGSSRESAVVGETPNLAARLQAVARPGWVVISNRTRQLTGGLFSYEDLGPQYLKGFAAPLPVWRAIAARRAASRFQATRGERADAFVGRQEELDLLLERWARARQDEGQVVLLAGEAGIGKSRVAQALQERLAADPHLALHYQCSPHHTGSALHPFIEQLGRAADLAADESTAIKLDKLERLIARSSGAVEDVAPLFATLLSIPTQSRYEPIELAPQQLKDRTLAALADQLFGLAAQRPLLMIVEDLHWADPTSLELLELIVDRAGGEGILIVLTARPEFHMPWADRAHATVLTLNRLSKAQSAEIIALVTGGRMLPDEVQAEIIAKTDGVPLFVEELTQMLLESDVLRVDGSCYRLGGTLPHLAIPSTLQDSLMARLDRLEVGKPIAQLGATIGRTFSYALVSALSEQNARELEQGLRQLTDAGLVFRQGQSPKAHYTFKHALIQEAACTSLLERRRRALHRGIAGILEAQLSELGTVEPETVAHHFSEAGLAAQAIPYWEQAATKARERSTYAEAVALLTKAISLVKDLPLDARQGTEFGLQMALGKVYRAARGSGSPETEAAYRRAHTLSMALGDEEQVLPVLYGLYISTFNQPNLHRAKALAAEIAAVAERTNNLSAWLVAEQSAGAVAFLQGDFPAALAHLDQALAPNEANKQHLNTFSENQYPSMALTYLSWTLFIIGRVEQAIARLEQGLDESKATSAFTHALGLGNACYIHQFCRDCAAIDTATGELIAIAKARGIAVWYDMGRLFRGWSRAFKGDTVAGIEEMEVALDGIVSSRQEVEVPYLFSLLAETCLRAGQWARGLEYLEHAFARVEANDERWFEAELHRLKGELVLASQDATAATVECHFRSALELARRQGARMWELRSATSLARMLRDQGEYQEACDLLSPTFNWFTDGREIADLREAKALLGELT